MSEPLHLYSDRKFKPTLGQGHEEFVKSLPNNLAVCRCTANKSRKSDGYRLSHKRDCVAAIGYGTCTLGCNIWVHVDCGYPSFSFSRECQVCQEVYMPGVFPDYDWLCENCGGPEHFSLDNFPLAPYQKERMKR